MNTMMKRLTLGGLLVLSLGAPAAVTVSAQDRPNFAGTYRISGKNPDGTTYNTGVMSVTPFGDGYKVVWSDGRVVRGVGTDVNGVFAVGYVEDGVPGVAIYTRRGANVLEGYWQSYDGETEGQETATRR